MNKILLAAIGILALTLSACGASAAATPVEPEPAPQQTSAPATELPTQPAPTNTDVPATESPVEAPAAANEISFSKDVMPIFSEYCTKCHGIDQVKEGLDLTTYDNLMAGSFNGAVIVPGNAAESVLADLVSKGKMPKRGDKPTPADIQIIINWINAGALNN